MAQHATRSSETSLRLSIFGLSHVATIGNELEEVGSVDVCVGGKNLDIMIPLQAFSEYQNDMELCTTVDRTESRECHPQKRNQCKPETPQFIHH